MFHKNKYEIGETCSDTKRLGFHFSVLKNGFSIGVFPLKGEAERFQKACQDAEPLLEIRETGTKLQELGYHFIIRCDRDHICAVGTREVADFILKALQEKIK